MRDASLRPSHLALPAAMAWAGSGVPGGVVWVVGDRLRTGAVRRCGGVAVWRRGAVWRCGGTASRLALAYDEELNQSGLAATYAAARLENQS
jgi:hypothetical protein